MISIFVTCPKCGKKINHFNEFCPSCGLHEAAKGSKEYNQDLVKKLKKTGGYGSFSIISSLLPCRNGASHETHGSIVSIKIEKDGLLYRTVVIYKCAKCGRKVKGKAY